VGLKVVLKSLSAQAKPIHVPPALLEYNIQKTNKQTNKSNNYRQRLLTTTVYFLKFLTVSLAHTGLSAE